MDGWKKSSEKDDSLPGDWLIPRQSVSENETNLKKRHEVCRTPSSKTRTMMSGKSNDERFMLY